MKRIIGILITALSTLAPPVMAAPAVSNADRTVQFPPPTTAIPFSAEITDAGSTVNNVTLHVDTNYPSAPGTVAFTPITLTQGTGDTWTGTIPGQAEGTFVKWYLEATNAASETTRYPAEADSFNVFQVSASPVDVNDVIINELNPNPQGSDNTDNSEWIEILNLTSQEIDLSYYFYGNYTTGPNAKALTEGTKIAPNGYLIIAGNKSLFMTANPDVDESIVYDAGWSDAVLPNSGGATNNVFFAHPNERNWQGTTVPFAQVPYINGENGFPSWPTTNDNNVSLQLVDPSLDITDGWNWNMSGVSTPGASNVVISHAGPILRYPLPNTSISFEAVTVGSASGVTLNYRIKNTATWSTLNYAEPASGDIWTATISGGFPDGTLVEWYVEAATPQGTVYYPYNGDSSPLVMSVSTSAGAPDVVVINEINYNPQGGDNSAWTEWAELYNPGTAAVDLSGVIFGRNLNVGDAWERELPEGTIIPAGGYLVLTGDRSIFLQSNRYGGRVDPNIVIDLAWEGQSRMPNAGGVVNLRYQGANLRETPDYIDVVPYTNAAPWPTGSINNGNTIELMNPVLDNSEGFNWRSAVGDSHNSAIRGTPGKVNSTFTTDIGLAITNVRRDIQYPTSTDDVSIIAEVQVDGSSSVSSAQAFVATTPSGPYTPVALTGPGGTGDYTGTIGLYPSGTYIHYYVEVSDGTTMRRFPDTGGSGYLTFLIADGAPISSSDVGINEIQADPDGGDNSVSSEWVEIMNLTDQPLDLSYFVFSSKPALAAGSVVIPEGTVVPARGFLLIVGNKSLFMSEYADSGFVFDDDLVIDAGWTGSTITNGANTISFRHVNAWGYTGAAGDPLDVVSYNPDTIGAGNNGLTAELIRPGIENHDNTNWATSLVKGGTPGMHNSRYQPVAMKVGRNHEWPGASDSIIFTVEAEATDDDPSVEIDNLMLYLAVNGGTYSPFPLTLNTTTNLWESAPVGPHPLGTVLSYYVTGTDTKGDSNTVPLPYGDHHFDVIITQSGNHVNPGDVVINEILYDNVGSDKYEFIELFNTTNAPIDLGLFRLADNELRPFVFDQGTFIAPEGFIIITMDEFIFRTRYGNPPAPIFQWGNRFTLANAGDIVRLVHPNQYRFNDEITPTDWVEYDRDDPWPSWSVPEDSPNVRGRSIELINPRMPDRATNGNCWAWTTQVVTENPAVMGTPGAQNSVYNPTASVNDWTLY